MPPFGIFAPGNQPGNHTREKTGRPDIPGTFVVELGLNHAVKPISRFQHWLLGIPVTQLILYLRHPDPQLPCVLCPGIGVSLERWKFKNGYVLGYKNDSLKLTHPVTAGYDRLVKSQFIANYIEAPLEFVYRSKPDDPARSFKFAIGGRVGYSFDSFTKVKYREGGEVKKIKDKQDFEINKFRYSLSARVGLGNVAIFGYYNMTPLFESGKRSSRFRKGRVREISKHLRSASRSQHSDLIASTDLKKVHQQRCTFFFCNRSSSFHPSIAAQKISAQNTFEVLFALVHQ